MLGTGYLPIMQLGLPGPTPQQPWWRGRGRGEPLRDPACRFRGSLDLSREPKPCQAREEWPLPSGKFGGVGGESEG